MSDLSQWFKSLPIFTRHWLGFTLAFTILGRFGIFKHYHLVLDYSKFIHGFQIWRPVTALFYYPLSPATGFHFLINCFFLYNYSLRLEMGHFRRSPADYCFMLLFNWACCVIVGLLGEIHFLMDPMVLSVLCVWCQLNPNVIVNFWFGAQFKAMYLPWVLFLVNLIISGGGILELVGILVGHLYLFLTVTLPRERGGPSLLTTPSFLYEWFPNEGGNVSGFGEAPVNRRSATAGGGGTGTGTRHSWGQGHVLGQN